MSYKYELHCHTGKVSMCGKVEPKRIVELYKQNGYSGIVLTDHYSELTFYNRHLFNPQKEMDFYLSAYRELKEYCKDSCRRRTEKIRAYGGFPHLWNRRRFFTQLRKYDGVERQNALQ